MLQIQNCNTAKCCINQRDKKSSVMSAICITMNLEVPYTKDKVPLHPVTQKASSQKCYFCSFFSFYHHKNI